VEEYAVEEHALGDYTRYLELH